MGPLSSHIHQYLLKYGYSYHVAPASSEFVTGFVVKGVSSGISTVISAIEKDTYLIFDSGILYDNSTIKDYVFMDAINCLNLQSPTCIKYFFKQSDSSVHSLMQIFISGTYPNEKFLDSVLHHTIQSLRDAFEKLEKLKIGAWQPKCSFD